MTERIFRLHTSLGIKQVYPANAGELIYKFEKTSSINFSKKLRTKLVFRNDMKKSITDFTYLYDFEKDISTQCEEIECKIYKICNKAEVLEYTGRIRLKSGDWDLDACAVSLSLEPLNDVYECIANNKKDIKVPISEWTPYADTTAGVSQYCPMFFIYKHDGTNFVFLNPSRFTVRGLDYEDKPSTIGGGVRYPHGMFAVLCYSVVQLLLFECGRDACLPMIRSDFFDWNAAGDTPGYIPSSTPKLPMNLPRENYPNGTNAGFDGPGYCNRWIYMPTGRGINYVTGHANYLTHLVYMPKSNANNNGASEWEEPITPSFETNDNAVSFEDIENIWATMFDAHWFIDSDGCMRVEHISWFNNNAQNYDSTTPENSILNEANRKYKYKDELLPQKEVFLFSANRDMLNGKVENYPNKINEIFYNKICVSSNKENEEKSYSLPLVTTDILAIDSKNNDNADFYNNDGLMLFAVDFGTSFAQGDYAGNYISAQIGLDTHSAGLVGSGSPTTYENGYIQWGNLIRLYLTYGRVLQQGTNGGDLITFDSRTRKTKEQVQVLIKNCCNDDEFNPSQSKIITTLGVGDIEEAELNTKTNIIKIKSLHD